MESFQGKINTVTLLLGIITIICGAVIFVSQVTFNFFSDTGIGIMIASFLIAPFIIYDALSSRHIKISIDQETLIVDKEKVFWKDLSAIKEIEIKRYITLLGYRILLRKLCILKITTKIFISSQWLNCKDYKHLRDKIDKIIPITFQTEEDIH